MSWSIELPKMEMPKIELPEMLGGTPPPPPSILDGECCSGLSYVQRITFFVACLIAGVVFLGLAVMNIPLVILGRADKFALPFVLANILFLASTVFLVGAKKQATQMFTRCVFKYLVCPFRFKIDVKFIAFFFSLSILQ
jgi:hypothetical protein